VVVGTGEVVVVGGTTGTPDVVVPPVPPGPVVAVVGTVGLVVAWTVPGAVVGGAFAALLPPCEEMTTAATTPAPATTATPTASRSFLTGQEATLARQWPIASKSS
jgi:hypothetical protein